VTTVLQYLVIAAVIGLVIFGIAVVVFGRGEQMAPLSPRTSPTELPDDGIKGDDVRSMRFAMALRGYRMSDVDWALERISDELDRLRAEVTLLTGEPDHRGLDPDAPAVPAESDAEPATPDPATGPDNDPDREPTDEYTSGART
jgi:DivIVA domain-containing protein